MVFKKMCARKYRLKARYFLFIYYIYSMSENILMPMKAGDLLDSIKMVPVD